MREALLIAVIVGALGAMLLPFPPLALDICLTANLLFALSLFMSSLYLSDALKLSALPTLLLITTLFRVALGVAATRSILSSGEAGHAVAAFGSLVMQGSVIVGLVVFLIITLVQFLVIAKGAERVAEVSARFSLDAMPGRQMAIDADVRSGMLDPETARKRRLDLQTESRFYGALDGAMKFIKGDAIAGIVIVAINIIGGLSIGLLQEGLSIEVAIKKFTLLSIGEGLLSQIPALLNALAAGMVVTRVTRGEEGSLAGELLRQIGQFNAVKVILGIVALGLSFVPGMPMLVLLMSGVGLLVTAAFHQAKDSREKKENISHFNPRVTPILMVGMPKGIFVENVPLALEGFRQRVFDAWGILLSPVQLRFNSEPIFEVCFRGTVACTLPGSKDGAPEVGEALKNLVDASPEEFMDDVAARRAIDFFETHSLEGTRRAIPDEVPFSRVTQVFRLLLAERIPISNIDLILQAIAEYGKRENSARDLLEVVRINLRRVLCYQIKKSDEPLAFFSLSPELDLAFQDVVQGKGYVSPSSVAEIAAELSRVPDAILLTSRKARLLVSECLRVRGVKNSVFAHEELIPEIEVRSLGFLGEEHEASLAA